VPTAEIKVMEYLFHGLVVTKVKIELQSFAAPDNNIHINAKKSRFDIFRNLGYIPLHKWHHQFQAEILFFI
jgi:hypothetical protein